MTYLRVSFHAYGELRPTGGNAACWSNEGRERQLFRSRLPFQGYFRPFGQQAGAAKRRRSQLHLNFVLNGQSTVGYDAPK
jgi:hypothetical protein